MLFIFSFSEFKYMVSCILCRSFVLRDLNILLYHSKKCTGISRKNDSHRYVCLFCPYHCKPNESMKRHLRKHTKDKPYDCDFCSLKFGRRDNLRRHLKDKHSCTLNSQNPLTNKRLFMKISDGSTRQVLIIKDKPQFLNVSDENETDPFGKDDEN